MIKMMIKVVMNRIREFENLNREMDEVMKELDERLITVKREDGELVFTQNRVYRRHLTESEKQLIEKFIELDDKRNLMLRGA